MDNAHTALVFFFGSILGSFLNVCIYRLPRKKSIVWPVSYCPQCKKSIPLTHQIPLVSYLILGGKCRNCKSPIPIRYPVVEFLTGLLLVLVWRHYGFGPAFLHYSILILFLLPISFIDLDTKLILNVLTFPGLAIGMASSLFLRKLG
ncbi:MAG: prepilin peptidase, partial [Calditrichaeota bacterium]